MAKTRNIDIIGVKGAFSIFKKNTSKKDYDFSSLLELRQLLSNERARILHAIKTQKPISIYALAKQLNRGFKSVNDDLKLLQKFGFIKLVKEATKNRKRYRPELISDQVIINVRV